MGALAYLTRAAPRPSLTETSKELLEENDQGDATCAGSLKQPLL